MEGPGQEQFDIWRQRAVANTLTMEEMREAIRAMRAGRVKATMVAKAKGTSKKVIDSNAMLNELEGL